MSFKSINKLSKIDGLYGFAAIMVVGTGMLNWLELGKGAEYYNNNTFFIIKFSLFVLVGLLSIYPTVLILRTKNRHKRERPDVLTFASYRSVKKVIKLELAIMFFIPLLAELMANGIDF